jgi:hypothetical protein
MKRLRNEQTIEWIAMKKWQGGQVREHGFFDRQRYDLMGFSLPREIRSRCFG